MPISNSTYSRGRAAKIKGRAVMANQDKRAFRQTKLTIRFMNDSVTVDIKKLQEKKG